MNQQPFRAPPREKTIQDYPQLKLTAPKEGAMERNPSMMMYVHKNAGNPSNSEVRFVVYTQTLEQDPKKQKIEAKMGLIDAITIMKVIQKVAKDPAQKVEPIIAQTYRPKDFKNRAAGNIEDIKIFVGKTEGGVYISLVHWSTEVPRKRFFFGFGDMFDFIVNAEKDQTFAMFSGLRALAVSETLEDYMKQEMKAVWKPWAPSNGGGNSGQAPYRPNNSGGGGSNYQTNSGPSDDGGDLDDIAW